MKQIDQHIRERYAELTQQEQKLADFILAHLEDFSAYNSVELATACNVSKATVSRFFRTLGYRDYREMREQYRQLRQAGVPVMANDEERGGDVFEQHLLREAENLRQGMVALRSLPLDDILEKLLSAKCIRLVGYRNSYPVALHFRQQLLQARGSVELCPSPGQTLGEELVSLTGDDLVVVVAFRRRVRQLEALLSHLHAQGIPVLLLADATAVGLADKARWWVQCPLDSISAFDSYSTAMSLVNVLVNGVFHRAPEASRERVNAIAEHYAALEELAPVTWE
ncbi:MurR/RpiR family transcriptional regulator [Pokkaliibacter sp. CJK22405]|uniref:MurR/RpiR family transcriptional regulator n=1 Tax=Pokkaliibacter sp. CJK22405 TaxID=3384615 RepID=UPI003984D7EB